MCGFSRKIGYVLFFMTALALLFFIIAVSTPNWVKETVSGSDFKAYAGLNKACTSGGGQGTSCTSVDYGKCDTSPYNCATCTPGVSQFDTDPCNKFKTTQALALLAVLLVGIATIAFLAMLATSSVGAIPQALTFLLIVGAGVCGMIAMSTYADLASYDIKNAPTGATIAYDFSFALLIIAWILCYAVFVIGFFTGAASGTAKISGSTA